MDNTGIRRILVCIASYGLKNTVYLEKVINEYRRMPFDVEIVVVSDRYKQLGTDVKVKVGLPSRDPHSLPFAHKKIFSEKADEYDLFIYSEDDIFISEVNINTFLKQTGILPADCIPGFFRFEVDAYGKRFCPDVFGRFHWIRDSVEKHGGEIFARFGNDHSAAYMLTRQQLKKAIDSGGYLVLPHEGDYDLECSAATDPYTQCGFRRLLCISLLSDILIHHTPNVYIGRKGIGLDELQKQIEALSLTKDIDIDTGELFPPRKKISFRYWDKEFYEDSDRDILEALTGPNRRVLSIGAGFGGLEADLKRFGHHVVAIPVDEVIAASLKHRNIEVLKSNFEIAYQKLGNTIYDCVILSNTLQHMKSPEILLNRLTQFLGPKGSIIVKIPNFNFFRWKLHRPKSYEDSQLNCLDAKRLARWFEKHCFKVSITPQGTEKVDCLFRTVGPIMSSHIARSFVLVASK